MSKDLIILYYPRVEHEANYRYFWMPFSILALAGSLEQIGLDVILLDAHTQSPDYCGGVIEARAGDCLFVGISAMTGGQQITDGLRFARVVRDRAPEAPIVWGGPHPTVLPTETLEHPLVDIVVKGQGEITTMQLAGALRAGRSLAEVDGLVFKDSSGVIENSSRSIRSKEHLPPYAWHLLDLDQYIRDDITIGARTLNYISSQGCPYACKFCYEPVAYGRRWSAIESARLIDDIETLARDHRLDGIKFYDADFFVKPSRVEHFCRLLASHDLDIRWAASAHVQDIMRLHARGTLSLLRDSGCSRILIGAESGDDTTLKSIGKQTTTDEILFVANLLEELGIIASFTFIVGFPWDPANDAARTTEFVQRIHRENPSHETRVHIFAPYPGTDLFDFSIEKGFLPPHGLEAWSDYNYYLPQTPWVDESFIDLVQGLTHIKTMLGTSIRSSR